MYRQLLCITGWGWGVGLSYRDPKNINVLRSQNDIYFTSVIFTISNIYFESPTAFWTIVSETLAAGGASRRGI